MVSSQRTEDVSGGASAGGVPGTASTLPRPTSRPAGGDTRVSRTTENITYQSSRTVKKTRLPAGRSRRCPLAVLVDQDVSLGERQGNGYQRVLAPPSAEKLKVIHDLVAGVTGFNAERGDQMVVETLPFEPRSSCEPPRRQPPCGRRRRPERDASRPPVATGPQLDVDRRRGRASGR